VTPAWIELVDARVAIAVRDVDVARARAQRHMGRAVEGLAAVQRGRLVRVADREEELSFWSELADRVMQVVSEPESAVGTDRDPVRAPEHSLPPRAQEASLAVEHDHGVGTPVEHVHVVPGVDTHARGLDVTPSVR
jgi:hypothetical protein